jgi:alanyl-tRNA synthetase
LNGTLRAVVDPKKRLYTVNNHSATHLMHAALRKVLGDHVEQKGSLVDENHLRFDFSHYSKLTNDEIHQIEKLVNEKIRENIRIDEKQNVPMEKALEMGAVALFGEKYGEEVRVITFDKNYSVELCGGTHVPLTGQIGLFKIISEGAIAAGIRRIEAVTALKSEEYVDQQSAIVNDLKGIFKSQTDVVKGVETLIEQNTQLQKQINTLNAEKANHIKTSLLNKVEYINGVNFLAAKVDLDNNTIRDLAFKLKNEISDLFLVLGSDNEGKAGLSILISESLVAAKNFDAGKIIREVAKEIQGGGGGQPHFATAGGKNPAGLEKVFELAKSMI